MTTDETIRFKFSCLELAHKTQNFSWDIDTMVSTANKFYQFATGDNSTTMLTKEELEQQLLEWKEKNLQVIVKTVDL